MKLNKLSILKKIIFSLIIIFVSNMIYQNVVLAKEMNIESKGSLTIHKYLNPATDPVSFGGTGFQGDGLLIEDDSSLFMTPLAGVEFSVYGRLTSKDVLSLLKDSKEDSKEDFTDLSTADYDLDPLKVAQWIETHEPAYQGVTDLSGELSFTDIPIYSEDLAQNLYLVVETQLPNLDIVTQSGIQVASPPVIVNIPSVNPAKDEAQQEVSQYLYHVHLYMKNYGQKIPNIEKTIDKPTHGAGEAVKYALTVSPLDSEISEFQKLEIKDTLDPSLNFLRLGVTAGTSPVKEYSDKIYPEISEKDSVQFYHGTKDQVIMLVPDTDYVVTTPQKQTNGTIIWTFTKEGLAKLSGITEGDGSYLRFFFMAETNDQVVLNQIIPNQSELSFINKWGYDGKPGTDKPGIPRPSEVVNTIFGDPKFVKSDHDDPDLKLGGAQFLVRNRSKYPITAYNHLKGDPRRELVTYPADMLLYAVIQDSEVVGWTPNWQEAIREQWVLTSDTSGVFHVTGLAYTHEVFYRKMYIFGVQNHEKINGTWVPYIDHYEYVLAKPRTPKTTQSEIQEEIHQIIESHKEDDHTQWLFYKESEVDPEQFSLTTSETIDYLGTSVNNYELVEVKAPEGYRLLENKDRLVKNLAKDLHFGTLGPDHIFVPNVDLKDSFKSPLPFTVPGGVEDWGQLDEGMFSGHSSGIETTVPNKKLPVMPITGVKGMFLLLLIGLMLITTAYILNRKDPAKKGGV